MIGANPKINDCCSHTFSNYVKAIIEGNNSPHGYMFRKNWQGIIQYPGAESDLAKAVMGETVAECEGVRFFTKYEQIQNIETHGPSALLKSMVKECDGKKWSETSSNHLLTAFDGYDQKYDLAMAMVDLNSMTDVGIMFCEACYRA